MFAHYNVFPRENKVRMKEQGNSACKSAQMQKFLNMDNFIIIKQILNNKEHKEVF